MSKLHSKRSFKDMVGIFKHLAWIILEIMIFAIICMIVLIILKPTTFWFLIPMFFVVTVSIVIQVPREKHLYHEVAREEELEKLHEHYQQYINDIRNILNKHDIIGKKKIIQLKCECEAALKAHNQKYNKIRNKIYDMLIGVPLVMFITCRL